MNAELPLDSKLFKFSADTTQRVFHHLQNEIIISFLHILYVVKGGTVMCSICGIFGDGRKETVIGHMNALMGRRGPDRSDFYRSDLVTFGHNRLAVIDPENGNQPMSISYRGSKYTIVYNGEIYNQAELNREIRLAGIEPNTRSDTETVLWTYILWGTKCPEKLNGIFAFGVYDEAKQQLFVCRDRLGVKPFYYAWADGVFLFASEIKSLLAYPGIDPEIDLNGLWELLFLTPVTLPESGTFKQIKKLLPGEYAVVDSNGMHRQYYWRLKAKAFSDSRKTAIETVRELVTDAVKRQMVSDVPLCTLLSGGLDSSVITAVAADACREKGGKLSTYSFEYQGNRDHFKHSLFQPESDDSYASWLSGVLNTEHTVLTAASQQVYDALPFAVDARDLPGQADIDSSLLFFCSLIKRKHTVALSGECSDEIFGGYPWFYRAEMLERPFFPWLHQPMARISLFDPLVVRPSEGYETLSSEYQNFLGKVEKAEGDTEQMYRSRVATQLSVYFFMQSLLERKDRMSMYSAVEVRVPFADHRILEYVYNVPWELKFENGVEKSLLRNAMTGWLPDRVLFRKKSPYPKTHDPKYEELTRDGLMSILNDPASCLHDLLDKKKVNELIAGEDITWFGQLMSRPQLFAWLIQLEYWMRKYQVRLTSN